jgi:uncharacterized protein (DUF362 family)
MKLSRRQFLAASAIAGLGVIGGYFYVFSGNRRGPVMPPIDDGGVDSVSAESKVYIVETSDRGEGVRMLLGEFGDIDFLDKSVALKANFNSADPPPASTHLDTLEALVGYLQEARAGSVTLAERSGMGNTRAVLESIGVYDLGERLGFDVISLDDLGADTWDKVEADWLSWNNGFYIAKVSREADRVIQTCCLKTHRFGGHFTMSLKNSVGLIAKSVSGDRHDYMQELHRSPHQRVMIGEISAFYDVDLVVLDALEAFVTGGPDTGILRSYGSTRDVMAGKVYELDQIRRAAEIGVGASSAEDIEIVPLNDGAVERVEEIKGYLLD